MILSCDKCDDIHIAQRAGKQNDECKCSCHKVNTFYPSPRFEFQPIYYQPQAPSTGDPPFKQGETWCKNTDDRDDPTTKTGKWVV